MMVSFPDKKIMRSQALAARAAVDQAAAKAAGVAVAQRLCDMVSGAVTVVAGYRAVRGEIDISLAMEKLAARGCMLCLPVIEEPGLPLFFRRWTRALEQGLYGIEVPPSSEPLVIPDAVIVPLVAFDAAGHRLGFGAGYYDRTIARLREHAKQVQIIGVAYSVQQVERIPAEAHDARLDAVVTEKGVIRGT